MTTLETAYAQLAALERRSSEMREQGKSLLPAEYKQMAMLREQVRFAVRDEAKRREGCFEAGVARRTDGAK